jgi:hypothetical protein
LEAKERVLPQDACERESRDFQRAARGPEGLESFEIDQVSVHDDRATVEATVQNGAEARGDREVLHLGRLPDGSWRVLIVSR